MGDMMYALVKSKPEKGLWLEKVPVPETGENDVKIKIRKTSICGTDVHIYNWDEWSQKTIPVPMTVGHEFVGEVVEAGGNVTSVKIGDVVTGEGHVVCGSCRNCRGGAQHLCHNTIGVGVNRTGAFAEYLVIPGENVWKCSDKINEDLYSCFDPFGNAVHTALSFDLVGEDVLITGAGPIGIMAVAVCKFAGARNVVITDINDYRLNLAKEMGATAAINVSKEKIKDVFPKLGIKHGFDIGLEMSGSPVAFSEMIQLMYNGGRIALLGIPASDTKIDWNKVVFGGLKIKGIYGREMYETWYKMSAMLESGLDIGKIITHRFDVKDFEKGFDAMISGQSGKVVLDWTNI